MPWYTDDQLRAIPALADADDDQISQATEDAGTLHKHISAHAGVTDEVLRRHAERIGIGPDRYNRAISVLDQVGKARQITGSGHPEFLAGPVDQLVPVLERSFTAQELRKAAVRAGADVPKSATKEELAKAIAGQAL